MARNCESYQQGSSRPGLNGPGGGKDGEVRVMKTTFAILVTVFAIGAANLFAGDAPALDAQKYPQDTPQNALQSIMKALDAKDYAYWIANLIIPDDSKRITEKHGGLEKAVAYNGDPVRVDKRAKQLEAMRDLISGAVSEVEKDGKKITRFIKNGQVIQFEQQPDKRWCMNIRVTTEQNMDNPGAGKAKAEAPKTDGK